MDMKKLLAWLALAGAALAFWKRTPVNKIPPAPRTLQPLITRPSSEADATRLGPTPAQPSGIEQILAGQTWQVPARNLPGYQKFAPYFDAATVKYGLPPQLIERQSWQESRFNPNAVSQAGALGIMQIMPKIHTSVNPLDPVASIDYAGRLMKTLYGQFGSWRLALAAYNAGPTAVRKYKGIPPYRETQNYVKEIANDIGLA